MTSFRWCLLIGLIVGVIWALAGFLGALETMLCAAIGGLIGLGVHRGVINVGALLGRDED